MGELDRPPRWPREQAWVAMWKVIGEAIKDDTMTARLCTIILALGFAAFAATLLLLLTWQIIP